MKNKKVEGLLLSRITVKHGTEGWGPDARTLVDGDGGPWARPGRPIVLVGSRGRGWGSVGASEPADYVCRCQRV